MARPLAQWSATGATGMVYFELPGNTGNYGMVHAVLDIYEYSGNTVSTVIVGGHNWNGAWYNVGANVIGQTDKPVRLGVRGGKYVICIGNSSSSWSYGTVVLRKIHNGGYYDNIIDMGAQFTAAVTTSESLSWDSGDLRALRTPSSFNAVGAITQNGNQVLHAGNYTSYAPSLTGSGASGTWGIAITGNAATASNISNTGTVTLASATEANSIYITAPSFNTGDPVKMLNFDWYGNVWSISNIRSGSTPSSGFGVYYTASGGSRTEAARWDTSRNFINQQNITAYSDDRLKKDWVDLADDFVEQVAKAKAGTYTRIDSGERQAGSSAQDWQKLLPEVVIATEDEAKTLTLAYGNAALVAAVKLAQRVVEQDARIARLESLLDKLVGDQK
jgi:hypothetical protein